MNGDELSTDSSDDGACDLAKYTNALQQLIESCRPALMVFSKQKGRADPPGWKTFPE